MNNKRQCRFAVLAGGLVAALGFQAALVVAQEDDSRNPFSFSVSQSFHRDSNLYRLPSDFPKSAVPKGKRSDNFSVTRAGVNFDSDRSRQAFHAGLSASQTLYSTHSKFNNTSGNARLRWDWRAGDRWSGVLGYSYSESSVGFDETYHHSSNRVERDRIIRQFSRANVSADFWWHPNWATGVGFSDIRNDYRNKARPYDKYDMQEASLNFTYRPSTGNRIVLSLRAEEGQYSNRKKKEELRPGETSMRDWEQRDARLSAHWQVTGVTHLNGYAGYTQRKYDLAPNRDFSGVIGKIGFRWVPTGKAIIELAWRREIGADQDAVSNYAVTQGWSLHPTWVVTSKIRLGASFEYLNRDYGGDPGYGVVDIPRDSTTKSYGVNFQYLPVPNANITLGFRSDRRDAERVFYNYRAQTMWLSGSFTF
jgi:exopolysaccharide biosynthesis operon protein EpsL